ncbi:MAG: hypothetical protein SOW55_03250 [Bacilli bacterium]|nr:hypothetical protein [Bacillales bacterium]MDY2574975.1 hypothetical protein [Bacilli bacterium]
MDKFFRSIGHFFKKIWDWIKTTAWVQPVLIVILVFLVIFSFSSSSPLMKWIKGLSNSDPTGEFYEDHQVRFVDLYSDVYPDCAEGKLPDGKSHKTLLKDSKTEYTYVLFVTDTAKETNVKTFYNNVISKNGKEKLYVVNFNDGDHSSSTYYNSGWVDDGGKVYYNYLFTHLYEFYNDSTTYDNYCNEFEAKYKYSPKYTETWEIKDPTGENPSSEIDFPVICKYNKGELIDFRFLDLSSSYKDNYSLSELLSDFYFGV